MDEAQKARIRLEHWINHNYEHLKGYLEVSNSLDQMGLPLVGDRIRNAVEHIDRANDEFRKALEQLDTATPASPTGSGCCCDQHGHSHGHTHQHEHCHGEASQRCHDHPHEHCHSHEHAHEHTHEHSHDKPKHRHD